MGQQRLRITFAKGPELKFISHLDLALTWERTLRRSGVPLAYSQGYNPQARLQLASGLPLGYTGVAEVVDVILSETLSPEKFMSRVRPNLPQGLSVSRAEDVPAKSPSLQSMLRQAEYRVSVETSMSEDDLTWRITNLLAADHLEQQRTRKGHTETFDLRPLVHDLRLTGIENGRVVLCMNLSAGQHGNVRPDTVLVALGLGDAFTQIERTKLLFEFDRT